MVQKLIKNMIMGLFIGLSVSYTVVALRTFLSPGSFMTGDELLEQVIIAACMGLVIGAAMLVYDSEKLSFMTQIGLHFMIVTIVVFAAGMVGSWFDFANWKSLLRLFLIELVAYVIVWFLVYMITKKEVDEINTMIKNRKESS